MENQVITIKDQKFTLKFGYGALRALGMLWKVPGPTQVGNRISKAFEGFSGKNAELGFEQIDVIGAMVYSSVVAADSEAAQKITPDDAVQIVTGKPSNAFDIRLPT